MNFDKIFFQLLIIKTLYRCGLSEPTEIAPLSEITLLNNGNENATFTSARFGQYENEDRFCIITDMDPTLYVTYFKGDFTSKSIEFYSLRNNEMEFLYRRPDDQVLWFKCVFSEIEFIQAFFRSIYSFQEKGDGVMIFRIARYFNASQAIIPYVKNAEMYSKDITVFSKGHVRRTYFITHLIDMDKTIEVDLIFHEKEFAISEIYKGDKIALCIDDIPDERILISFTGQKDGLRILTDRYMPEDIQHDNIRCEFPENLTPEEIFENLDKVY